MNSDQFDALTKSLAKPHSRRAALKALAGAALGGLAALASKKPPPVEAACTCPSDSTLTGCSLPKCSAVCPSGMTCQNNCCKPCGGLGQSCCGGNCNTGFVCGANGKCGCAAGQTLCGSVCVTCPTGGVCSGSTCGCPTGTQLSGTACVATCGGTGQPCCSSGAACTGASACCDASSHCVANLTVCSNGAICSGGTCTACGAVGCPSGFFCSGGTCLTCSGNVCGVFDSQICCTGGQICFFPNGHGSGDPTLDPLLDGFVATPNTNDIFPVEDVVCACPAGTVLSGGVCVACGGTGQPCCAGTNPCTSMTSCCDPSSHCVASGSACSNGQICTANTFVEAPAGLTPLLDGFVHAVDGTVAPSTCCNAGLKNCGGTCRQCCFSSDCTAGKVCAAGVCVACDATNTCPANQYCNGGACQPCSGSVCGTGPNQTCCPSGQTCVSGACCANSSVCNSSPNQICCTGGSVCSSTLTSAPSLNSELDRIGPEPATDQAGPPPSAHCVCPPGTIQGGNGCVSCGGTGQLCCSSGAACTATGACCDASSHCVATSTICSDTTVCSSGTCAKCGTVVSCPSGYYCSEGNCLPCAGSVCGGGINQTCCTGTQVCVPVTVGSLLNPELDGFVHSAYDTVQSSICCNPGQKNCGGVCQQCCTAGDCSSGQCCDGGTCVAGGAVCSGGSVCISNTCTSCSASVACPSGYYCNGGICQTCAGTACGAAPSQSCCPSGQSCVMQSFLGVSPLAPELDGYVPTFVSGGAGSSICCPTGQKNCGGVCTDTNTDSNHCGGCLTACAPGHTCQGGACV